MSENGDRPELSEGWNWETLEAATGEDGLFTDGDWILAEDLKSGRDVRLLQLGDIGVGTFVDKSSKWISQERFEELGCTEVLPGDLLISRMAEPIARACRVPLLGIPLITAVDVTICRIANAEFEPEFVLHVLNSSIGRAQAEAEASGTTRKRITRKKLAKIQIPKPPLREQLRIVEGVRALGGQLRPATLRLDEARRGLADLSLASRRDLLTADRKVTLGTVAEIRSGLAKGRKTRGDTEPRAYLRAGNLGNGELLLDEIKEIEATDVEAARCRLQDGDVLLVEGSGSPARLGQGWVWEGQVPDCLHQNHVFVARPDRTKVEPRYLAWSLQGPDARRQLLDMAKTTSGLATLNKKQAASLMVPLPSLEHQRAIVERLDNLNVATNLLAEDIDKSRSRGEVLYRSVLHDLLTGRTRRGQAKVPSS